MQKLKYWVASAIPALATGVASAQSSVSVDVSAAENAADAIGTAMSGLINGKIMTNVLLVIGAGLAVYGVFLVVRYVRRGAR